MTSLGSPGASRIPTAIAQALINVVDFGMPLRGAVLAPASTPRATSSPTRPARESPTSPSTSAS
ncbi:hypothetical protein GBA65_11705 [Rubrobacter marinus]|uniref:Uncharacterized protein n=1 Tax=Rubrobacter marinus TaxID=2653852 RepID=A0A6G8PY02_9ACTN|nr:gamma-glutamyltransferase [Rubrobacter marinus]QIN79076.1 hypothetical protein GBA65_11705 [Rubrobacter marinus]